MCCSNSNPVLILVTKKIEPKGSYGFACFPQEVILTLSYIDSSDLETMIDEEYQAFDVPEEIIEKLNIKYFKEETKKINFEHIPSPPYDKMPAILVDNFKFKLASISIY